ncbi:MAG: hypothetical protein H6648_02575 [Caldilineae bacterium]|nr:hypothetical protein [Chloroflexota bacterium]MCB9176017.1 hypothetical protein [Caldilineae bacterium]
MHPPRLSRRTGPLVSLIALGLLSSGCRTTPPEPDLATAPAEVPASATLATDAPAADEPAPASSELDELALEYRGPREPGGADTERCTGLRLDPSGRAELTACDAPPTPTDLGAAAVPEWQAFQARLSRFELETATEGLRFEGQGPATGEPWQRALLAWARLRHAELASGRASASGATAMSWFPEAEPDASGACAHLTVLAYGYAYAERRDCESGALLDSLGDWLSDAELAQLDVWLYDHAAYQADSNTIDGRGDAPIAEPEAIEPWALALHTRLRAGGEPIAAGAPDADAAPEACPTPSEGQRLLLAPELGLCALVPASHTVFTPSPGSRVVAKDSLLDVSAPRLAISVGPAMGLDVEQAADAYLAEMAGFEPSRSNLTLNGSEDPIPAVLLDGVPGQDLYRLLLFVHADQRYELRFSPADDPAIDAFYDPIVASLRLFPVD